MIHDIFLYEWKVFKILKTSLEDMFFLIEINVFTNSYLANKITEELLFKGITKLHFTYYLCASLFCPIRVYASLHFWPILLFFLPGLYQIQCNLHKLYNICITNTCVVIYVIGVQCSVFLFSLIRNNLLKQILCHKNLSRLLIKDMLLESFWAFEFKKFHS